MIKPERFILARQIAGLSMQELTDKMGNICTKQAISRYENGVMQPSKEIFDAYCKATNNPPSFFYREFRKIEIEGFK